MSFDINPFLTQSEGQTYDRKSLFEGVPGKKQSRKIRAVRNQVAKYVSAFTNADGGLLVLGIEDNGEVTGHALRPNALSELLNVPQNRLHPPQPEGFTTEAEGKEIIVFDVPCSDVPVIVNGGGSYLRVGDQTVQIRESFILASKVDGMTNSWERRPSNAALSNLDAGLLEQARKGTGLASLTDTEYLLKRNLACQSRQGVILYNAAELFFACNGPEHPNAGVRLFRVVGTERRTGATHNVEEHLRSEGNLPSVILEVGSAINRLLRRPVRLVGNRFREVSEYPEFVWREALLNAVAHRDYGIEGHSTEIWLFDDRMEIVSPGTLVGALTLNELLSLDRVHYSRNPRTIRVLVDLNVAREQGEGVPRMFSEMDDAFLRQPDISVGPRNFAVALHNTPVLTEADYAFIAQMPDFDLSRHEIRILIHAHHNGQVDNATLRGISGLDTLSASVVLRGMREKGLLELHSFGSRSYYTLILPDGFTRENGPDTQELGPDTQELGPDTQELPACILNQITRLGKRPRQENLRPVIHGLCNQGRWVTSSELAQLLNVRQSNLSRGHLGPMVAEGSLVMRFPDNPTHPGQAYRAVDTRQLPLIR